MQVRFYILFLIVLQIILIIPTVHGGLDIYYYTSYDILDLCSNTEPSTKTSINNLKDALSHYRGKSGKQVVASECLISEMRSSIDYVNMLREIGDIMFKKITYDKIKNQEKIRSAPGSRRGLKCPTLGSYSVNIDYEFIPQDGLNIVTVNFWGYDTWDFEWNKKKISFII